MKKRIRRLISALLTISMVVGMFPVTVMSEPEMTEEALQSSNASALADDVTMLPTTPLTFDAGDDQVIVALGSSGARVGERENTPLPSTETEDPGRRRNLL